MEESIPLQTNASYWRSLLKASDLLLFQVEDLIASSELKCPPHIARAIVQLHENLFGSMPCVQPKSTKVAQKLIFRVQRFIMAHFKAREPWAVLEQAQEPRTNQIIEIGTSKWKYLVLPRYAKSEESLWLEKAWATFERTVERWLWAARNYKAAYMRGKLKAEDIVMVKAAWRNHVEVKRELEDMMSIIDQEELYMNRNY